MGEDTPDVKGIKTRLSFLTVVVLLAFLVLLVRLWQVQILHNEKYSTLSENNRIRVLPVKSPRGYIKDRNGNLLVENRPEFKLYVIPREVPDMEKLLARIKGGVNVNVEEFRKRWASSNRSEPVLVKGDLSRNELAFAEEHRDELPGAFIQVEPVRYYRYGPLAAHLLGYLGEINREELRNGAKDGYLAGDYKGKSGLEKVYEKELRGEKGRRFVEVDSRGRELRVLGDIEPSMGAAVTLTIDLKLQLLAESLLQNERGAVVAMDPRNGQVLAYASKPAFDPNLFANGLRRSDWQDLRRDETHPLQDRVIQGQYPPGSVFKIIVAAAALEEGVIDEDTILYCPGYYYFGGRKYRDWKKEGHGALNLHRALVESCDVFFYQLGEKLGVDIIQKYARGFGLGRALGVVLGGEKNGLIPSSEWKRRVLKQPWFPGETLSAAIGQGYVLTTPLQLATLIGAVANGGTLYLPQFLKRIQEPGGKVVKEFKPRSLGSAPARAKTMKLIREALRGVVNEPHGTGAGARISWVEVAGKTGTAQVVGLDKGSGRKDEVATKNRDHAWFVSFAPFDDPTIAVVIFIENAGRGGSNYAYMAKELIETYLREATETDGDVNIVLNRQP